jgi:transposase
MMSKKKKHDNPTTITATEGEELISRLHSGKLSETDKSTLSKIIRGYIFLSNLVTETGTRIKNIREFFFPRSKKTKKTKKSGSKPSPDPEPEFSSYTDDLNKPLAEPPAESTRKRPQNTKTNHGRLGVDDYTGAKHEYCRHEHLKSGDRCPECQQGKLYSLEDKKQIQLFGGSPVQAICHHVEVLRCASCLAVFNARENTGKYDDSVKSIVAISRYYMGLPFHRLKQFQKMAGIPLPDSTQWDLVKQLFDDVSPVFNELIRLAAQAEVIHHDDTSGRILSLIKESKNRPKGIRYGTHSTGMVAIGEQTIILYFTGRCHSGENMGKLLDLREADLAKPIQVSDASSSNQAKGHTDETIPVYCNAHGVRKFKAIDLQFPEFCLNVLVAMGHVFENDEYCKKHQITGEKRMLYHQKHSKPALTSLKMWMQQQLDDHLVEDNSRLGEAIHYLLNHWTKLTKFLTVPNAPLDNNIVERVLKRLIFQRKNSFFFANEYSAYVGCALSSVIMTCEEADVNAFDYLNSLQENRFAVAREPENWLPWNYKQQISTPDFSPIFSQPGIGGITIPNQNTQGFM